MRDASFNDTTLGMLKAHHLLTEQRIRRSKAPAKQKFTYGQIGTVVHARRCLKTHERAELNAVLNELHTLDGVDKADTTRIKELLTKLRAMPVTFVPIKSENKIDYSKSYPSQGVVWQ